MANPEKRTFETIDVENLNIVDRNGRIKMTLFNGDNVPPAIMDGKNILPGHRQGWPISGILFYNGEGDECGGLIFGSEKKQDGTYRSFASLTFDQYKQDEVVQISYSNENGVMSYGFAVADKSKTPLPELIDRMRQIARSDKTEETKRQETAALWEGCTRRAFVGKTEKGEALVQLMDSKGKQRIRMLIDEHDTPKMEFLDEAGSVVYQIPPA